MIDRSSKRIEARDRPVASAFARETNSATVFAMKLHWVIARAVFVLAAVAVGSASALSPGQSASVNDGLRFGQSIALSDFDSDGFIDEARLDGFGLEKRVRVILSGSGRHVLLHFGARWIEHGSLFARDLDDNGTADLVWTDLLHGESVIVWLGDGSGRFTRSAGLDCRNEFAPPDNHFTAPADPTQETAINFENEQTSDQPPHQKSFDLYATEMLGEFSANCVVSSPALDQPADRGPPVHNS
jgi:hypothetical protein